MVAALINITYGEIETTQGRLAYMIACIVLGFLTLVTMYTMIFPLSYYDRIQIYPDYNDRHCMLFLDFRRVKHKAVLYYAYFLVRRMLFSLIIVCLKDYQRLQCVLIMVCMGYIAWYQIYIRPYKSCLQNWLSTYNELILVIFSCMMFVFLTPDDPKQLQLGGYICIGIIIVFS